MILWIDCVGFSDVSDASTKTQTSSYTWLYSRDKNCTNNCSDGLWLVARQNSGDSATRWQMCLLVWTHSETCRIQSVKRQRFWPANHIGVSNTPMWLVNVLGEGHREGIILLVPRVTCWANYIFALARTLDFQGSISLHCKLLLWVKGKYYYGGVFYFFLLLFRSPWSANIFSIYSLSTMNNVQLRTFWTFLDVSWMRLKNFSQPIPKH